MADVHDGRYRFAYATDGLYGHVLDLVARYGRAGGCVVDVGCGYGAIAEPCQEVGFTYVGLDLDPDAVADLRRRGYDAACTDLRDLPGLGRNLEEALAGRRLAAVTLLDTLEHLVDGVDVLAELRRLALAHGPVPLVVSVPNVTHLDVAAKLLLGRWDVTPTGLLDRTHVSLYGIDRLDRDMAAAGWVETAEHDYRLSWSDQHFPADAAPLALTSPLHGLLRRLRESAAPGAAVNQFVRAYLPGPEARTSTNRSPAERSSDQEPFLTVVVATGTEDVAALPDTLLCLAGQDDQDFEVVVVGHNVGREHEAAVRSAAGALPTAIARKVRYRSVDGGPPERSWSVGAAEARGSYVALLTPGALPLGHWVSTFAALARRAPGHVLRVAVAEQDAELHGGGIAPAPVGPVNVPHPLHFDLLDHLGADRSPAAGLAFPVSCFADLGLGFDETLPAGATWELLLRAASWCGVADSGEVTVLDRRWRDAPPGPGRAGAVPPDVVDLVLRRLDAAPLLLPAGSAARLRSSATASDPRAVVDGRIGELEAQLGEVYASTSWRVSAPLRLVGTWVKRLRRSGR